MSHDHTHTHTRTHTHAHAATHVFPEVLELEQLDLEKNPWVIPMGDGLWRIDPSVEHPPPVTGVVLPADVPFMNDTTAWSFNSTKKLGSGTYKQVFVGKMGDAKVAICKVPAPNHAAAFPPNELNYLSFEMRYQMLFHRTKIGGQSVCADLTPNIFGVHEEKSKDGISTVFLIREFLDGSLDGVQFDGKEHEAVDAAIDMAVMLKCLKNSHVLHRDIKPSNYLYRTRSDGTKQVFLQDFGLAANACDDERNPCSKIDVDNLSDQCGSGMFMPPETFASGSRYKFDMYSQGVTFRELGIADGNDEMRAVVEEMTAADHRDRPEPDELLRKLFAIRVKLAHQELEEDDDDEIVLEKSAARTAFEKMKRLTSVFRHDSSAKAFRAKYPACLFEMSKGKAVAVAAVLGDELLVLS